MSVKSGQEITLVWFWFSDTQLKIALDELLFQISDASKDKYSVVQSVKVKFAEFCSLFLRNIVIFR